MYLITVSERLYKLVQPTRVLYLAVDGVAPRAKMNQQRSRRFRKAKDDEATVNEILARTANKGGRSPEKVMHNVFDSNCITPGTDFMLKLSLAIQKWVSFKIQTDIFWQNGAHVILSGPDVPGEGEHKVMDFIRQCQEDYQKSNPDRNEAFYQPDYTHVMFGLDADLIMLGLVTHEPNFFLLREKMSVVMAGRGRNHKKKDMLNYDENDFEVLELNGLRQMLTLQLRDFEKNGDSPLGSRVDMTRVVNDFVFLCMLVGNDFLPHCPHLEISNGALSIMMSNYIDLLPDWGGYLTKNEKLHPQRFEQLMYHLSLFEEEHFKRRSQEEKESGWGLSSDFEEDKDDFYGTFYSGNPTPACAVPANFKNSLEPSPKEVPMDPTRNQSFRRQHPSSRSRSYRDFYYETKLGWKPEERARTLFRRRAHARDYVQGLHWVLNYYHKGCASWDYYFPHLYSPLATDLVNIAEFYETHPDEEGYCSMAFEKGEPFPSLAQLLAVLPPQSSNLLPKPLAELMLHPSSPIIGYYPRRFTCDANGKRQSWEEVVNIPFIEAGILLDAVESVLKADVNTEVLTNAERRRNAQGKNHVFKPLPVTSNPSTTNH